jgi:hypothetical protein
MAAAGVMTASAASTATGVDSGSTAAGVASTATSATVAASTAMADKLNHRPSVSLFVEDVERRQADIGDFLLTECEVIRIIPWNIGNRTRRQCGCAACQ